MEEAEQAGDRRAGQQLIACKDGSGVDVLGDRHCVCAH